MYAKIFTQIFDSSIAENYRVRHVFEDLLKLADISGSVDMTYEAIARRTNMPLEMVREGIRELMKPDEQSRSKEYEGRRLIPLDDSRDWGWVIVNYAHYRSMQDEEARRATWRNSKAKQRLAAKGGTVVGRGIPTGGTLRDRIRASVESDELVKQDRRELRKLRKRNGKAGTAHGAGDAGGTANGNADVAADGSGVCGGGSNHAEGSGDV